MRKFFLLPSFIAFAALVLSCHSSYQAKSVQYKDYRITQADAGKASGNADINALLKPYADSVNKSMNDEIAVAATMLEKKQPEGPLGDVLADAMLAMSKEKFNQRIDAAFMNYGGIRLSSIPPGSITRGKVFELSPFDNNIVVLKLSGKIVQQFLNHVASRNGWPCAGLSFQIKNKTAVNIVIAGNPFDVQKEYIFALPDYVANGGDDCTMFAGITQQNIGYLLRDSILQYFFKLHKEGKQITASIENRITNAE